MANYARSEREALSALLEEVGPDAPTLCEGWQTADLAAHLVLRDRRPDAAAGIVIKALAGHTQRVQRRLRDSRSWPDLVATVRRGPPLPVRIAAVDAQVNTAEYFVHHEDVRRARPGWEPRDLPVGEEQALWARLKGLSRLVFRRSPVGVVLDAPGHGTTVARRAKDGGSSVTISGPPSELVLFASGRDAVARVELHGDEQAQAELRATARRL
ncbi:MAG TPA: TIGR03085 family metal-binding protein [Acidimicrobiales bacterium]|nr:TIGR03085 family metal-binding protein [Acidimicrobiales bacterium]